MHTLLQQIRDAVKKANESIRLLLRTGKLLISIAPGTVLPYLIIIAMITLAPVIQVWLAKEIIDHLTGGPGTIAGKISAVLPFAIGYVLTLIVSATLQPLEQALSASLEERTVVHVDRMLLQVGERLSDLSLVERPSFQDDIEHVREVALYLPRCFPFLQNGVGTLLTLAGLLILLSHLSFWLPCVLVIVTIPHFLVEQQMNRLHYQTMREHSRAAREMIYCVRVTTEPAAAKEIRIFALGDFFLERFKERFKTAVDEISKLRLRHLRHSTLFGVLHALALAGGLWYVAIQAGAGKLTLGDVALYLNAVIQSELLLTGSAYWLGFLHKASPYIQAFFQLIDTARPAIRLAAQPHAHHTPATLTQGIELRHISFTYPEQTQPVLQDVSFPLPTGKITALVGNNGAGKSTLVKLLTRMYDPTRGTILLDGVPLEEYDLEDLRRHIAVVYQDFARFSLTLRENITLATTAIQQSDEQLEQAAAWAGADEVAHDLPQSYDTPLTKRFEGGVELSGGQWQKVALARGFVRDAALIILDEPTAALDADAEYALFERFRALIAGKTALLISHRFSTVRMADLIVVLENGAIIESGAHDELLRLDGRYASLFEMQAGRYR